MPLLPDSGDPGDIHEQLGIGEQKPDLLTDATWAEINAKYQLRGEKGRGSQAVVFEAEERAAPHCRVALKVYHENTDTARQQFENECRILASKPLPPEVVRYYGCVPGKDLCQPYLVIDFIDGTTLAKLALSLKQPLTFDAKVDLIEQLGRSFHRLHDCNLIFGEGSANNILVEIDYRLRFVDLAGAKDLIKGHGRSRKSINLVTPGFFAQTDADAPVAKEVRTNLATDLYAMSANAFLLLTGRTEDQCRSVGSRNAEREWNQALVQAGVKQRGLRAIVLKGLRVPDPLKSNDLRLYSTAAAFANDVAAWRTRCQQRRSAVVFGLPALVCVIVLAVVALVGWSKYETERTAFELRRFQALQERLPSLAKQPAIDALIKQVDELAEQRQQQLASQQTNLAATTLRQMTLKLEQAFATSAALQPCVERRTTIARELVFDPKKAIIPWHVDNPFILKHLKQLQAHNDAIRELLERGDTDIAGKEMDKLQEQIYVLETSNRRAMSVNAIQQRYDSLHGGVSEWLKSQPEAEQQPMLREIKTIDQFAKSGQVEWTLGGWDSADRNFGSAIQGLNDWLDRHPMAKNSEIVQKKQQADVEAGLRTELSRLSSDIDTARKQRDSLQASLDALNEKLKSKDALTAKEQSRADELAKDKTKLTEQLATLTTTKQALSDQLKTEKEASKKQLATIGEWKTQAEAAAELIANLKPSDGTQPGLPQVVFDANKIAAAIKARLDKLDPTDRESVHKELNNAVVDWQKNEVAIQLARQKRMDLLKTTAEDGQDMLEQDRRIATLVTAGSVKEATARQALAKRDVADRHVVDERNAAIAQFENIKKTLMGPPLQLLANNEKVLQQDGNIAEEKRKQAPFAEGATRAAGTGKKPTMNELVALSGASGLSPFDVSGLKTGDLRGIKIGNVETRWRWIPPGKFKMGSPIGEKGRDNDEDQKEVTISKGFWMLETEVAQELWTAVMGGSLDWDKYGKGPKHPVYNVSHTEASEFCTKFNALLKSIAEAAGLAVRLPTEAEWEYAARAGTTTRYYWGDRDEDADQYAWHGGDSNGSTQPVGQKKENAWGLKDMFGNVWEWCSDAYAEKLLGGTDPRGPSSTLYRVNRGGGWRGQFRIGHLQLTERYRNSPEDQGSSLGFRLACSPVGG